MRQYETYYNDSRSFANNVKTRSGSVPTFRDISVASLKTAPYVNIMLQEIIDIIRGWNEKYF